MHARLALALTALFASSTATAFQPSDTVYSGIEPQRIRTTHPAEQARLRHTPAFARFERAHGNGWTARFDEATGTPIRMYGPGIELGALPTEAAVLSALRSALAPHAELIGTDVRNLRWQEGGYIERRDAWYVDLDVVREGLPIWRGGVTARIQHGRLTMFGAETYPDVPLTGALDLSAAEAIDAAIDLGPAAEASHTELEAVAMLLPLQSVNGLELRRVWLVSSRTTEPAGRWRTFVDGLSGEVLSVWNEVRFLDGAINAEHHQRNPDGPLETSPAVNLRVEGAEGVYNHTDDDGLYSVNDTDLQAIFYGPLLDIDNKAGADAVLPLGTSSTWTTEHATQAEIDTWVFIHMIREWGLVIAPEINLVNMRLDANVNLDQVCNAYFDGAVNFYRAGQGCRNTGELSDVIFHEWGHGFHYWSLETGDFDGSLSEGAADTVAFLQTADSIIAPGFLSNGRGIREVATNKVWPDDYSNDEDAVHSNGLIFGGAMWDLWAELEKTMSEEEAHATTEQLLADLLKGGPTIENVFEEILFADDDDGDLANGTPNECALIAAFALHGLGPLGAGEALQAEFLPPLEGGESLDLSVSVTNVAARCVDVQPSNAHVEWRINGGAWQSTDLDLANNTARGAIPNQPLGTFVEYVLVVEDSKGGEVFSPEGGRINPFSYYVGDVVEVSCNDFETDDGGFTSELVAGVEREGANDWQWGTPSGSGGDPSSAYSGDHVWGTDLGGDEFNGEYQSEKYTRLTTPPLSTRHYDDVFVRYMRWLSVEDGLFDQANLLANGELVWSNWANTAEPAEEHTIDRQWSPQVVNIGGTPNAREVTLAWEIQSDRGLNMGGWNIDDLCLLAPATPDNRLGISDLVVTEGDEITLSWTQPAHAPVEEVVVVRKRRGWPSSHRSGTVVWRTSSPDLGERVEITDDSLRTGGDWYYAVYASDGENWLSWTRPGLNAASTSGAPAVTSGGCGCASSGSPAGGAGLFGLLLLALGRRRR